MLEYGVYNMKIHNFEFSVGEQNKISFLYASCYRSKDGDIFQNHSILKFQLKYMILIALNSRRLLLYIWMK